MRSEIRVRAALPGDEQAMREITRMVWQGTDYVPLVWDRWLDDARGMLQVATLDGQVVGFQHVAIQPDESAWLEGIRVAESAREAGMGRALLDAGLEYARLAGCAAARLATASVNPASTRLAERGGFRERARFRPLAATTNAADPQQGVRLAQGFDLDAVMALAERSGQPFYTEGWTAYRLTRDRLRLLLNTQAVALIGANSIEGMAVATCREPFRVLRLGFLAGSNHAMRALCRWLIQRAAATGLAPLSGNVLVGPAVEAAQAAGFARAAEMDMVLYERQLAAGPLVAEG